MKIYTKTGDKGTTALFGAGRVSKTDPRIEAYGTVDELNSHIGLACSFGVPEPLHGHLREISALLFSLGSDLATPLEPPPKYAIPRIAESHVLLLEERIDSYEAHLAPLKNFILPGGTPAAGHLHAARTVCRRAERRAVALAEQTDIGPWVVRFLNRLSDYLFVAARYANHLGKVDDIPWHNPSLPG